MAFPPPSPALEEPSRIRSRAKRSPPCRRKTGDPPSSPPAPSPRRAGRGIRALTGEEASGLLRRHRAHRAPRIDRFRYRLVPVALRQGRSGRRRGRLHQPARWTRRSINAFVAALLGRKNRFQGMGKVHALFRGLPAHRSDGGARPKRPALRADEAGGPERSAHRLSPHAVVQLRQDNALGTLVEHGGLPDQAEAWRAVRIFRTIPGLEMRSSRGWAGCIATPSSIRRACWTALAAEVAAAPALRRPDHRRGRLCRKRRHRACWPGRFAAGEALRGENGAPPPPTTAFGALLAISPAAPMKRKTFPADEREFRGGPTRANSSARPRATSWGRGRPSRASSTASRHHASRISPIIGSRTVSPMRASSWLNA
jgi:hypothetical protein